MIAGLGVTVGYHRLLHPRLVQGQAGRCGSRWPIAGSLAIEGPVIRWVADHRRHHKYSDKEGDPHSPWRYGDDVKALTKGLLYAHIGWLFDAEQTYAGASSRPTCSPTGDIVRCRRLFPALVAVSLLLPPLIGGLWSTCPGRAR